MTLSVRAVVVNRPRDARKTRPRDEVASWGGGASEPETLVSREAGQAERRLAWFIAGREPL